MKKLKATIIEELLSSMSCTAASRKTEKYGGWENAITLFLLFVSFRFITPSLSASYFLCASPLGT